VLVACGAPWQAEASSEATTTRASQRMVPAGYRERVLPCRFRGASRSGMLTDGLAAVPRGAPGDVRSGQRHMSSKGFGRSLLEALAAVVVLAMVALGMTIVQVFEHGIEVPGGDVLHSSTGTWSTLAEPPPPDGEGTAPPEPPEPPDERLSARGFADGTALAVPLVAHVESEPAPIVHWFDGKRWRPLGEIPRALVGPSAVQLTDGRIVVADAHTSVVVDPEHGTITPVEGPMGGEWIGDLVGAGDRAYVLLEELDHYRVKVFVGAEGRWKPVAPSPMRRMAPQIYGQSDGSLVIRGGWTEGSRVRIEGVLWMLGLVGTAAVVVFFAVRALRRGVHRGGTIIGALLGVLSAFLGFIYLIAMAMGGAHGRPLRIGRRALRGRVSSGQAPRARASLPWPTRWLLARAWARDAALEHASVAAFEQLARQLEAVSAPAELVAGARRAAAEEAEHTRLCLALAERYVGHSLTLAPTPVLPPPAVPEPHDRAARLEQLALESLVDGTVGEGWAAAAGALAETTDPAVRHALEVIARDEASHAAHARDVVAFCEAEGGELVREGVRRATIRERRRIRYRGLPVRRWTEALAHHGRFREPSPGALDASLRARL
jgi:hypothetical protein